MAYDTTEEKISKPEPIVIQTNEEMKKREGEKKFTVTCRTTSSSLPYMCLESERRWVREDIVEELIACCFLNLIRLYTYKFYTQRNQTE